MAIELAFFDDDSLLCRGTVRCEDLETTEVFSSSAGHRFEVTHRFELPACPVEIVCFEDGKKLYESALRVGVHKSDDWESINLGDIHTLGFRCVEP